MMTVRSSLLPRPELGTAEKTAVAGGVAGVVSKVDIRTQPNLTQLTCLQTLTAPLSRMVVLRLPSSGRL